MNFVKGKNYRRVDLHEEYGGRRQSGISNCPKNPIIFIFTNPTHKQDVYEDKWDSGYFYYSGEGRKGDMTFTGGNRSILNHEQDGKHIFLFENSGESGYWTFVDELKLVDWSYYRIVDEDDIERNGIQFKLLSVSKENTGEETSLDKKELIKYNYNEPDITEREGLVTSRVGQGTYRKRILERWNNKCSVTNCRTTEILISSHIVPWSKSTKKEKYDVGNGLLLSPNLDSLFDKHLISFKDSGEIIISNNIDKNDLDVLGINSNMKLRNVYDDMISYLSRHREVFYEKN